MDFEVVFDLDISPGQSFWVIVGVLSRASAVENTHTHIELPDAMALYKLNQTLVGRVSVRSVSFPHEFTNLLHYYQFLMVKTIHIVTSTRRQCGANKYCILLYTIFLARLAIVPWRLNEFEYAVVMEKKKKETTKRDSSSDYRVRNAWMEHCDLWMEHPQRIKELCALAPGLFVFLCKRSTVAGAWWLFSRFLLLLPHVHTHTHTLGLSPQTRRLCTCIIVLNLIESSVRGWRRISQNRLCGKVAMRSIFVQFEALFIIIYQRFVHLSVPPVIIVIIVIIIIRVMMEPYLPFEVFLSAISV